ncbi:MAG: hypothetical protein HKN82_12400 [Akkermansiaceae bacterium]|nr:hypothetical protein [Akkermansiaceae bacterium]
MDSRKLTAIFLVTLGLLFGVYAMAQILTQGWNALTETFKYVGGALLLGGFIVPRFGLWVLLISLGYLDLVKRLLVLAGTTTYYDIGVILAFGPILALAIFAGVVLQDIRKFRLVGTRAKLFVVTCALMLLLGATPMLFAGMGLGGMKQAANYGAFVTLLYVIPALFDSQEKLYAMLRRVVWIFIPVALYAFWQTKYGLSWWEIEYLETGLSTEFRILFGQEFRVFSTLNSSQNLSKVMAMVGALAFMIPWSKKKPGVFSRLWGISLLIMFNAAAFFSGSRTGLVMGLVAIACFVIYRYKLLTLSFYAGSAAFFVLIVIVSDSLLEEQALNRWTGNISESLGLYDEDVGRVNLATFSVRLQSFSNLKDPGYWTPFGFKVAGKNIYTSGFKTHDMLGKLLLGMGYIPLSILIACFGYAMLRLHQSVWRVRHFVNLKLIGISQVTCVIVGGFSAQENIGTFPVNALLYLAGGTVIWATFASRAAERAEKTAAQPAPAPVRPGIGRFGPGPSPTPTPTPSPSPTR